MFRALYLGEWERLDETNVPLEPLELSKLEFDIIVARMKKLAKDASYKCANALQLVHDSYREQEWERQAEYGDFQRPTPGDKKAWEQYEKFIALAVKLLSKYRGIKGDWRTDRFSTIPTNDRSSIGSMAAAQVESVSVKWTNPVKTGVLLESVQNATIFQRDGEFRVGVEAYMEKLYQECNEHDYVIMEGPSTDTTYELHIYDFDGEPVEQVTLTVD